MSARMAATTARGNPEPHFRRHSRWHGDVAASPAGSLVRSGRDGGRSESRAGRRSHCPGRRGAGGHDSRGRQLLRSRGTRARQPAAVRRAGTARRAGDGAAHRTRRERGGVLCPRALSGRPGRPAAAGHAPPRQWRPQRARASGAQASRRPRPCLRRTWTPWPSGCDSFWRASSSCLRDVSHRELRSPLARLQLALSLAARDRDATERHLARAVHEADRWNCCSRAPSSLRVWRNRPARSRRQASMLRHCCAHRGGRRD